MGVWTTARDVARSAAVLPTTRMPSTRQIGKRRSSVRRYPPILLTLVYGQRLCQPCFHRLKEAPDAAGKYVSTAATLGEPEVGRSYLSCSARVHIGGGQMPFDRVARCAGRLTSGWRAIRTRSADESRLERPIAPIRKLMAKTSHSRSIVTPPGTNEP